CRRAGPRRHRLAPVRGRGYLSQRSAGRAWRVSVGAFWQVHPAAADALTDAVLASLQPRPGDVALDLYCGAGLFAGVLAPAVGPGGTVAGGEGGAPPVPGAPPHPRGGGPGPGGQGEGAPGRRPGGAPRRPRAGGGGGPPRRAPGWPVRSSGTSARPSTARPGSPTCPATRPR